MAARERIAARITGEGCIPLRWVVDVEIEVNGLHGIGALIEQALREPVEDAVGSANHSLAVAKQVIGKARARCEILEVVVEDRV